MDNDVKFFRNMDKENGAVSPDVSKKIFIPLPDLGTPSVKAPEKTPPVMPTTELKTPVTAEKKETAHTGQAVTENRPSNGVPLPVIFIAGGLLLTSVIINIFLSQNASELNRKLESSKMVMEGIYFENEKAIIKGRELESEIAKLDKELAETTSKFSALESEKSALAFKLDEAQKSYALMSSKLTSSSSELERLKQEQASYAAAYEKEKSKSEELLNKMQSIEAAKSSLNDKKSFIRKPDTKSVTQLPAKADIQTSVKTTLYNNPQLSKEAASNFSLAVVAYNSGLYDEAISKFKLVLKELPKDAYTHYNLGVIYEQNKKDKAGALNSYQKCLSIAPGMPGAEDVRIKIASLSGNDVGPDKILKIKTSRQ